MKKKYFKITISCLTLFVTIGLQAQQTTGDIAKSTVATKTVKLIDNKGTIKYLQAANGLTLLTNTTNDRTTTTWQLGGELTSNTYIDVKGKVFALDALSLVTSSTSSASTDAASGTTHGTGTGWTLLVRDEATGAIQKLKATDLIQSGTSEHTAGADSIANVDVTVTGISTEASRIWVYRNGAKLVAGNDYKINSDKLTLIPGTTSNSLSIYQGDYFEIQWIK